jgi:uncharacterized protein YifN (PemK superfamily)
LTDIHVAPVPSAGPSHHLNRGKLVEVDFGHHSSFVTTTAMRGKVSMNPDMSLREEMHKRRLAVVVSVGRSRIQVAPVTSVSPPAADRSVFELSGHTLSKLHFYGGSGKRSYVLCGMVETVSVDRVLAPQTTRKDGAAIRNYRTVISRPEFHALDLALTHGTGVLGYEPALAVNDILAQRERELLSLQARLATSQAENEAQSWACHDWREAARELAKRCGASADEEMAFHRELRLLPQYGATKTVAAF